MKLNEALIIFLLTIFCAPQLFSTDFLITVSGHYELGTNLPGNGDSNGTIRIQASYVTLDLGNYTVFQGDSSANATASSTSSCIFCWISKILVSLSTPSSLKKCSNIPIGSNVL